MSLLPRLGGEGHLFQPKGHPKQSLATARVEFQKGKGKKPGVETCFFQNCVICLLWSSFLRTGLLGR